MIRSRRTPDRGESLVELLVAVLIMGTAVVAVVGGLSTSIMVSGLHRDQAQAAAHIRAYAAQVQEAAATGSYDSTCPIDYPAYAVGGFTGSIEPGSGRFWNGTGAFVPCPGVDVGVQMVTLVVSSPDGRVDERMNLVVRRP